jgi:hypothetical protein
MPMFHMRCRVCKAEDDRLLSSSADISGVPCRKCGRRAPCMRRAAHGPSVQVMERLDNGAMPRAVERLADAERLYADRAAKADPLAGGAKFDLPKSQG